MKTFNDIFGSSIALYLDLARRNVVSMIRREDGRVCYDRNWEAFKTSDFFTKYTAEYMNGITGTATIYVHCEAFKHGPKVISAPNLDCEALENTDLTLRLQDYNQPFETVIVELPQSYSDSRECPVLSALKDYMPVETQKPRYVIVCHKPEFNAIATSVVYDSKYLYTTSLVNMDEDYELEDGFIGTVKNAQHTWEDSLQAAPGEDTNSLQAIKVALNIILLVDEFGLKRKESAQYDLLCRHRDKAIKTGDKEKIKRAVDEIRRIPVIYEFEQEVQLYAHEHAHAPVSGEESGIIMPPHRRRGHYRMQPHGPQSSLRKRIRIKPTLINAHLFAGDMSNLKTTYKLKKEEQDD